MKIYAIRHGQTDWNSAGKIQGKTDIPLNQKGREQACEIAQTLLSSGIDTIISSPLKRAMETAEIVAGQLHIGGKIVSDERLSERDFGDFEGRFVKDVYNVPTLRKWSDNVVIPNGESIRDTAKRVFECLDDVFLKYRGRNILLVVHGHVIRTVLWYFNGIPEGEEATFEVGNCEVYEFER
ncbi:MAG: histidine phosphatase family protein [Oscillospiraceae bacterium]|nr:histidine phosphatase family protein [Oscillospiraceae bacterium]